MSVFRQLIAQSFGVIACQRGDVQRVGDKVHLVFEKIMEILCPVPLLHEHSAVENVLDEINVVEPARFHRATCVALASQ